MKAVVLALVAMLASAMRAGGEVPAVRAQVLTNVHASAWARDGDISCRAVGPARYRLDYRGERDWSFNGFPNIRPLPGEEVELSVETAASGDGAAQGHCQPSFVVRYADGRIDYGWAARKIRLGERYEIRTNLPAGVVSITPRVMGSRAFAGVIGPCVFRRTGRVRPSAKFGPVTISNDCLSVTIEPADKTFAVTDRRTRRTWTMDRTAKGAGLPSGWPTLFADRITGTSALLLFGADGVPDKSLCLELEGAELSVTLDLGRETPLRVVRYPHPFATQPGERLIIPYNEGMGYPVDEEHQSLSTAQYACGFRMSMHFFGVVEDATGAGVMGIVETQEDANMEIYRLGPRKLWAVGPGWIGEFGKAGYPRRMRYVFQSGGGHVKMAKRFRAYAKANGWLKTFGEKAIQRPNVKRLPGAPNIWAMIPDGEKAAHAKELKALGVSRFLWSSGGSAEAVKAIAAMDDVLIGRYDNTQDVFHPSLMAHMGRPGLLGTGGEAWPHDVMWTGSTPDTWRKAWGIEIKEGTNTVMDHCATMCDVKAPFYEYERVREELKTKPYTARFLDTTFSEPWKECSNPAHRQTRRESHFWRKELLRLLVDRFGLVTGSERGSCSGVPVADYFEGMMSISFCGLPRAGRDIQITWTNDLPEVVTRYQVGAQYRLPLWELVFHDCCCAHWYWGDTQNKAPEVWDRRTLFNVLYGTSPVFLYNAKQWPAIREHVAATCRQTIPIGRKVGFSEMTDHQILTPDRQVQRTVFANGVTITVNFSDRPWTDRDGHMLEPGSFRVEDAATAVITPPLTAD